MNSTNEKEALLNNSRATASPELPKEEDGRVAINGFEQVYQMLRIADPEFRDSLLRRLAARDPELARSLRNRLAAN
jgi:hypothetical protein